MSARKNARCTPLCRTIVRTPLTCKNQTVSTVKKRGWNSNMPHAPSTIKRKLPSNEDAVPSTKRSLFTQFISTPINKFKTTTNTPIKKLGVVTSTLIKRKSNRPSGNSRNKRKGRNSKRLKKQKKQMKTLLCPILCTMKLLRNIWKAIRSADHPSFIVKNQK